MGAVVTLKEALTISLEFLKEYWPGAIALAVFGALLTHWIERRVSRLKRLIWTVVHDRVGVSANGPFGDIKITFNNTPLSNLFLSTVEIVNVSERDIENLIFRLVAKGETKLLVHVAEIEKTSFPVSYSDDFQRKLDVADGQKPTIEQFNLFNTMREFKVPVLNRKQRIIVRQTTFTPNPGIQPWPHIETEVQQLGVETRYLPKAPLILGVPRTHAHVAGLIGIVCVYVAAGLYGDSWISNAICLFAGLAVMAIGATLYRIGRSFLTLLPR